jgi:hypothetical protein
MMRYGRTGNRIESVEEEERRSLELVDAKVSSRVSMYASVY